MASERECHGCDRFFLSGAEGATWLEALDSGGRRTGEILHYCPGCAESLGVPVRSADPPEPGARPAMNLRESLERWDDAVEDPLDGREQMTWACGFVRGFAEATGARLALSTNGRTMRIHDLGTDTRSAAIVRSGLTDSRRLLTALRAQLDARPHWIPESDRWGPNPWPDAPQPTEPPDAD